MPEEPKVTPFDAHADQEAKSNQLETQGFTTIGKPSAASKIEIIAAPRDNDTMSPQGGNTASLNTPSIAQTPFQQPNNPSPAASEPASSYPHVTVMDNPSPNLTMESYQSEVEPPTAATNPTVEEQPNESAVIGMPKKSRKKWFVIGGIAVLVLLLGVGGAGAYAWYQSPDKVVTDSILSVAQAESGTTSGTFTVKNDDMNLNVKLAGAKNGGTASANVTLTLLPKSSTLGMSSISLTADVVTVDKSAIYFKLTNVKKLVEDYVGAIVESQAAGYGESGQKLTSAQIAKMKQQALASFTPIVTKIDGQWIKVSYDELDQTTGSAKNTQTCVSDVEAKAMKSGKMQSELVDLYQKNRFIVVQDSLGVKNGSVGYVISFDSTKAKSFVNAAKNTEFAKELKKCDSSLEDSTSVSDIIPTNSALDTTRFEIWADRWSHDLTAVKVASNLGKDASNAVLNLDMKVDTTAKPAIAVPKNAMSFKEIQNELNVLTGSPLQETNTKSTTAKTESTTAKSNAATVQKVVEMYAAEDSNGGYPTLVQLQAYKGVTSLPAGIKATSAQLTSNAGDGKTIQYIPKGISGACIGYWDITLSSPGIVYLYAGNATTGSNAVVPVCA